MFKNSLLRKSSAGTEPTTGKDSGDDDNMHDTLPKTMTDAFDNQADIRPIVVTETQHPFPIVKVNQSWQDLCGYSSEEAVSKSMSDLIQGPKTNREDISNAMYRLAAGAEHVECTTVNYRKDKTAFTNRLAMGPLYDDEADEENKVATYYVGVLMNIGELASEFVNEVEEKEDLEA